MSGTPAPFFGLLDDYVDEPAIYLGDYIATRKDLTEASNRAAAFLSSLGMKRGDVIALWLPDGPTWLQFLFAAASHGILVVPISTRYRRAEALHVIALSRAKAVVAATNFLDVAFAQIARDIQGEAATLEHVVEVIDPTRFHAGADGHLEAAGQPGDLLCTFSTSGTTGAPKLAIHDQQSCRTHALTVASAFDIHPGDKTLCALPLYGVLGFVQAIATLAGGGACVLMPVFKASEAASAIERHAVTHVFGSDGLLDAIFNVPAAKLSTLRAGGFADFAGLTDRVMRTAEDRWGLRLVSVYGSSEGFALMAARSPSEPIEARSIPGGRLLSGEMAFRIVELESGAPVPPGATGELQIRGYNVMPGYLNNEAATARSFTSDGWFRTGDFAYAQHEAFVFLSRIGDGLRLRGYLVDPSEIEAFLCRHPVVSAAQVVGVRIEGEGDVAVAFVRADRKIGETELLSYCREGIANYKVPRRIVQVDGFPVIDGPNGTKIRKATLREHASQLLSSAPMIT
ncbi:acid--CoA ligase [Bradyrhizobium centrolobii]|uniref:Acid--CoA ligase n=1 Tax=Bradyrhizobium centrolobii TaxID=1505087 RepID=A0A176Y6E2_9BRAD|nr:AMP-binding protein [Bradyrhizobium centrolobii]OAE96344.1 acid--CoA ligase [Bradyrhizobium centrolobii]